MGSLLDSVVNATERGPNIVHENHAYARKGGECHNLAIGTRGRVACVAVGEVPWHQLGTVVDQALTSKQAIELAGLDYHVVKRPLAYEHDGRLFPAEDSFATLRTDNGAKLGVVGSRYAVVQNAEAFDFMDEVCGGVDGARYHTAGALGAGETVWILAETPHLAFDAGKGDPVQSYVLFSTSHDGSSSIRVFPTTVRVVCQNTHRAAMTGATGKGIAIRHTAAAKSKIEQAKSALGQCREQVERFASEAKRLATIDVGGQQNVDAYWDGLLDSVCDITAADALKGSDALAAAIATTQAEMDAIRKRTESQIKRRRELLDDIVERWESDRCPPTAWGAYNAVSESVDHGPQRYQGSDRKKAETRFASILYGRGDQIKQEAFAAAGRAFSR